MIGAKISARLNVRGHEGGCTWRPPAAGRRCAASDLRGETSSGSSSFPSSSSQTYSWRCSFARRRRCLRVGMSSIMPRRPGDPPASNDAVDDRPAEVVREVPPVVGRDEHDVGVEARGEPPDAIGRREDVGGVHRAGSEGLGGVR